MPSDLQIAYFLQQAANAVPLAALYSLLAFGYALTFGLTRRAEFTAGTLFAFAGQLLLFFTALGYDRLWLIFPAALALGAVVAFAYTLLVGWVFGARVLRPLAFVSPNAVIVASLALMILLMELVRIASDNRELWLPPLFNTRVTLWNDPAYPVVTTVIQLANVALMVLAVTGGCLLARPDGNRPPLALGLRGPAGRGASRRQHLRRDGLRRTRYGRGLGARRDSRDRAFRLDGFQLGLDVRPQGGDDRLGRRSGNAVAVGGGGRTLRRRRDLLGWLCQLRLAGSGDVFDAGGNRRHFAAGTDHRLSIIPSAGVRHHPHPWRSPSRLPCRRRNVPSSRRGRMFSDSP